MSFLSRAFTRQEPEVRSISPANWGIPSVREDAAMQGTAPGNAMSLAAFYACVTLLADTIAARSLTAYTRKSIAGKKVKVPLDPQPKLLATSPYPGVTWFEWLWMLMEALAVTGNGFGYVTSTEKDPKEPTGPGFATAIMPIHPSVIRVDLPERKRWPEPVYFIEGEEQDPNKIIHIKRYPVAGAAYGLSPIQKAAASVGLGLAAERYGLGYFRDSANPSSVLETDQTLDADASRNLMKRWISSHGGRRYPAVLSGGVKWKPIAIPPNESQFLECVVAGTPITMADGTRKSVEDIRVGEQVMAWNGSKLEAAPVKAVGTPPVKPLVRITTARGRTLTATTDHPVLGLKRLRTPGCRPLPTDGDWIPMGDLQPGQHVRVALGAIESHTAELSPSIGYFLGAMVGDGYIRRGGCSWTSAEPNVTARMSDVVNELGGRLRHTGRYDYSILTGGSGRGGSIIRGILNESGLVGTHSHDKFVPEVITAGGPTAWRAFLSGYFDADGSVRAKASKQTPAAYWSSTSRDLLDGCQHLLALLGVNSSIYPMGKAGVKRFPGGAECNARPNWGLYVTGISEIKKLAEALDPANQLKAQRLAEYRGAEPSRYRPVVFEYDAIKTVEHLGAGETIGVEIEGLHTHVTAGIITHNTRQFQRSDIAMWFRIPPHMIGDTTKSTSWGTGIEQQAIGFTTFTLTPWLTCIEQAISAMLPTGVFVKFNIDGLLRGDVKARWEAYRIGRDSGVYSPNDIREFEDLPPVENGDGRLQPMNFVPLGTTAEQLAGTNPAPEEDPDPEPEPADEDPDGDDEDQEDE